MAKVCFSILILHLQGNITVRERLPINLSQFCFKYKDHSPQKLLSGTCVISATPKLPLPSQLVLWHFPAAVPGFGLFISPLVSTAMAIKHRSTVPGLCEKPDV